MYTTRSYGAIWPLLFGLLLTACDELKLEKTKTSLKNKETSSFFHPWTENGLSYGEDVSSYIPVYSGVYVSGGGKLNLAITLSVRNTDFSYPLLVKKVSYYNTAGQLIENYLKTPHLLEPMASTHFFVTQADARGGVGANFIVTWATDKRANAPIIEAVMAGSTGTQGMSFISSGREMKVSEKEEEK